MVKKVMQFQCSKCNQIFGAKEKAEECEGKHAKPLATRFEYEFGAEFPSAIVATFIDGEVKFSPPLEAFDGKSSRKRK